MRKMNMIIRYTSILYSFFLVCALCSSTSIKADNFGIRVLPSVESPLNYTNFQTSSQVQLDMVRGEVEHLQLVFKCNPGDKYSFKKSSLGKGLKSSFRELKLINGYYDALVPMNRDIVCEDTLAVVWITFACDYATKPGEYKQTVEISGRQDSVIEITLLVHGVDIPRYSSIPVTVGVENRCITDGFTGNEADKEKQRWVDFVLSYRMTPVFGTQVAPERWQYDHSFSPWSWNDKRTWKLLDDERYSCFMLPYFALSHQELNLMLKALQKKDKLEKCLFYIWDEPAYMDDYKQIISRVDTIRKIVPEAKVLTTFFCGPRDGDRKGDLYAVYDYLKETIDVASTSLAPCGGKEEEVQAIREHAPESMNWWSYICWEPGGKEPNFLLSMKGIQQRAIMWRTWKNKSEGFLYWDSNIYHKRIPFTYITDMPHGDGILIYPGDVFGTQGPVASARLERWRDGVEEMELLRLLEQQRNRAASDNVLQMVYHSPSDYIEMAGNIIAFRKRLISEIEESSR